MALGMRGATAGSDTEVHESVMAIDKFSTQARTARSLTVDRFRPWVQAEERQRAHVRAAIVQTVLHSPCRQVASSVPCDRAVEFANSARLAYDRCMHYRPIGVLFCAGMLAACVASPDSVRDGAASPAASADKGATQSGASMRVYLDPKTGLPTTPPTGVVATRGAAAKKPPLELQEEPAPGGGFQVELNGRMQNYDALPKAKIAPTSNAVPQTSTEER